MAKTAKETPKAKGVSALTAKYTDDLDTLCQAVRMTVVANRMRHKPTKSSSKIQAGERFQALSDCPSLGNPKTVGETMTAILLVVEKLAAVFAEK